jgi:hypothetical protein
MKESTGRKFQERKKERKNKETGKQKIKENRK